MGWGGGVSAPKEFVQAKMSEQAEKWAQ